MRRKVLGIAMIVVCVIIFLFQYVIPFFSITTYVIPPEQCPVFVGCSPKEYVDNHPSILYSLFMGFDTYAKVDKNGNLVLCMNKFQQKNWRAEAMYIIEHAELNNVEFSPDFTHITVYADSAEGVYYSLGCAFVSIPRCWALQFLNGGDFSEMGIDFTVKAPAIDDKIVYHVSLPYEDQIYVVFQQISEQYSIGVYSESES